MNIGDLFSFFQSRLAQCYAEQVWAVALAGAMCGFVIVNKAKLHARGTWLVGTGVGFAALFALFFIWSRQFIFLRYDGLARNLIARHSPVAVPDLPGWQASLAGVAGWSGTALYTVIVVGMTWAALRALKK